MIPMMNKRSFGFLGLLFGLAGLMPTLAWGSIPAAINTRSAMVINASTGKLLFEHNADAQIPPASITKVLTLYLVFEAIHEGRAHLWDRVAISEKAAGTGGSRMYIQAGTEVTLEDLMKGMAVDSGNDACVAAGEHLAGSEAAFVAQMNHKAQELGMSNSHFVNPNGLPARGQVTTARDMAKLSMAYLHRFPESLRFHSMQTFTYRGITQHNRNRLLGNCPGVDGLKTGWIAASGYNLLATAKRGDTRILVVVLGAPNPAARLAETRKLLEVSYQKVAVGSPAIELADLTSYVDPYCPAPGKKTRHAKVKKTSLAKRAQPQAGKRSAKAKGQMQLAKKTTKHQSTTIQTKQQKAHQAGNQVAKAAPAKNQQQTSAPTASKHQATKLAKHTAAKSARPAASTGTPAKSTSSNGDHKTLKKKANSHQANVTPQKANTKAKDKTADSKKKAKPQAKKSSSQNT